MKRAAIIAVAVTQKTDASCHTSRRGMGRRNNRHGAKRLRQHLKKEDTR
jgi:predicted small secreted protein